MDEDLFGAQQGTVKEEIKAEIIKTALEHKIMTQFTSFVAVEETVIKVGGEPLKVTVPVEMPDGVSREGVFGEAKEVSTMSGGALPAAPQHGGIAFKMSRSVVGRAAETLQIPATQPPLGSEVKHGAPPVPEGRSSRRMSSQVAEDKSDRAKAGAAADEKAGKLAPELRKLLGLLKAGKNVKEAAKEAKVTLDDGKILVQVSFAGDPETAVKLMEGAGLGLIFRAAAGKTLIGKIEPENLEKLAAPAQVIHIKPVAPEK
jgi:Ca-activated chloride channel family protein